MDALTCTTGTVDQPGEFPHRLSPQYVRLIIHPGRIKGCNQRTTAVAELQDAGVETEGRRTSLFEHQQFNDLEFPFLDIIIESADGTSLSVCLPDDLSQRLLDYLVNGCPENVEDCRTFVQYMYGLPIIRNFFRFKGADRHEYEPGEALWPGDIVRIYDGRVIQSDRHFAIYLANGLFLSKGGEQGPLIVADLENMKKAFGGSRAEVLRRGSGASVPCKCRR